ncbi:MAG: DUF2721 domain-containing protein [Allosphingosinicella sp.]|uniref:DUF2721 domain-containing protein n=1 Tax=Allosphingosinicella sp. TaxID=2823234 RepID=UPI00393B31E1
MDPAVPVTAIAHLIQLALAPVFLLAGIGAILNVMAQRLARVVDRSRVLEQGLEAEDLEERGRAQAELRLIDRRMTTVHLAISCCTASALFVCLVVATLFVADLTNFAFGRPVAWLFIAAMLLLVLGLLLFLVEITLAMRSLRLHRSFIPRGRAR